MKFKITSHSGFTASMRLTSVVDLLWQRLGAVHDEVSFAKVGSEISATWEGDVPASMTPDERAELGRRAVLDIVREVCKRAPELESDWFAVGVVQ